MSDRANEAAPIRILIADDQYLVRRGIRAIVEGSPEMQVVAEAEDGRQAVELYRSTRPDVAILDYRMPVLDGAAATAAIVNEFPDARIIALSHYEGDEDIHLCLRSGATTYVLKRSVDEELPETIRAVHQGVKRLSAEVATTLSSRAARGQLSARERSVLQSLSAGKTNKEIATELGLSTFTVNNHVANVLLKLDAKDRTQAVTIAIRRGLVHLDGTRSDE